MTNFDLPQVVLVPVEEAELVSGVLRDLGEFAKFWDVELVLLHVWEPLPFTPPESTFYDDGQLITYQAAARKRAVAMLDKTALEAAELGLSVGQQIVRAGIPAFVIVEVAEELGVGWIAMASHQRHGLSRWFLGSVTERVCGSARVPVLTVPFERQEQR